MRVWSIVQPSELKFLHLEIDLQPAKTVNTYMTGPFPWDWYGIYSTQKWMVDFFLGGKNVGKYTVRPMDPMGVGTNPKFIKIPN